MVSFKIIKSKNGFSLVKPLNDLHKGFGYIMVVNPKKEVLKFFQDGTDHKFAIAYLDYVSLNRWGKIKYWLNYKRC